MTGRALLEPDTSGTPEWHESAPPRLAAASALWLVRHGQSGWNVAGRIQGQSPAAPGLTATGRDQAAVAARKLARRAPRATLIVASDLARAAETAEVIAVHLGLPVEFDPALREQSLGDLEGCSAFAVPLVGGTLGPSDAAQRNAAEWAAEGEATGDALDTYWEDPFRKPPGGESVAEMDDRVHRALDRITAAHPGAALIIVTHGGPVRVAGAEHPLEPGRAVPRTAIANASITPYRPPSRKDASHPSP